MTDRIVLAFSGGAKSTAAASRLAALDGAEIVALTLAVGQGREIDGIREQALAAGARRCHVLDVEEEFAREVVWPAVRAGADPALPPIAILAPVLARALVDMARIERADAVAHAADGIVARPLEASIRSLAPAVRVIRVGDTWETRRLLTAFLEARGLAALDGERVRAESTLWGRRVTGSLLADPWITPPPEVFGLTRAASESPDQPALLDVAFERGVPVAVNDIAMPLPELLASVGTIAGVHAVGRQDLAGVDDEGRVWRAVHESPSLTTLRLAHEAMTDATSTLADLSNRHLVACQYSAVFREGLWHTSARRSLEAAVDAAQAHVTGVVRLSLFKGHASVVGRRAERYDRAAVSVAALPEPNLV